MTTQPKLVLTGENNEFYDNTKLSDYKTCPRKYQLRHQLGWRSEGTAIPLSFGLAWHAGQDAVWKFAKELASNPRELRMLATAAFLQVWEEQGLPVDLSIEDIDRYNPRTPSVAAEMYDRYIGQRWNMLQASEIIAIEQPFAVPVPGMDNLWYVGRLDKVVEYNGQVLVIEHKTTTEYKKDGGFKTLYIESWSSDSQSKGYQYGGGLFFGVEQVWIDAALVHKTVHDAFRLVPVAHQHPLLMEWLQDTKDWISRIQADTKRSYFPKNESSCVGKFGACQFLDICRTVADPRDAYPAGEVPPGYIYEPWNPFEVLELNKLINKESTNA